MTGTQTRSRSAASRSQLNAIAGYINFAAMAILGFIANPILLSFLGPTQFGIWRAAQRLLDFVTVADGRATQALKWVVAFNSDEQTGESKRRDVGAAIVVWLFWLPVLSIACITIIVLLPHLIKGTTEDNLTDLRWVGAILCANLVLAGLLYIPDSVLVGTNQGYRSMTVTTVFIVVANLGMILAVYLGFGIISLALVTLLAAVGNGLVTWLVGRKTIDWWGAARPLRSDIRRVGHFSGWILAWSFIEKLLLSTELVLISIFMGAVVVTGYVFTSYVTQFALAICMMTVSAVVPRIGASIGAGEVLTAAQVAGSTRRLVFGLSTLAGSAILLFNGWFVTVWGGPGQFLGPETNALMVISFLQLAIIRSDAQMLDAGLNVRAKVYVTGLGAVASLVISGLVLASTGDLNDMLVALVLCRVLMSVLVPRLLTRLLGGLPSLTPIGFLCVGALAICYAAGRTLSFETWAGWLIALLLITAIALATLATTSPRIVNQIGMIGRARW
jgi:O-antigen/teichoic acid export membrane protein